MKVALIIPAKGHSARVPGKNLYRIGGCSLVYRACERALACRSVTQCYLDTEDKRIIRDCCSLIGDKLHILHRPLELATNATTGNGLMTWELEAIARQEPLSEPCDVLCQTFATAPLLKPETIDRCVERFCGQTVYDSFLTVEAMREHLWDGDRALFDVVKLPDSCDVPVLYRETHGLYGVRSNVLRELQTRTGKTPLLIPISKREALDVNDEDDLWIAEKLLA